MEFIITALGNAHGEIRVNGEREDSFTLHPKKEKTHILHEDPDSLRQLTFLSERGKLADSEDSLLFFGFKIDPSAENFRISADFYLDETEGDPGWLSGFGAFAIDTLACENSGCRHRNMLSAGIHRSVHIYHYARGLRIVSGYTDPEAFGGGESRKLDASHQCARIDGDPEMLRGTSRRVCLQKTDAGFTAAFTSDGVTETLTFPGCDFLMKQEGDAIYAGFGAAGSISVTLSDIHIETTPGRISHTPQNQLKNIVPDYPFDRSMVDMGSLAWRPAAAAIHVSPDGAPGNAGTAASPLDFQSALLCVSEGGEILLEDGLYQPAFPYVAPVRGAVTDDSQVLIRAKNTKRAPGGVVFDGSNLKDALPVMILAGDHWRLDGIVFTHGKGPGLFICGSGNQIEHCEARENGDTGFLICTYPGTDKAHWPCDNLLLSCASHDNRDPIRSNADGFGAKLSIGAGNRFVKCAAYHNADDGFDFYSKSTLGPIGAVTAENCIAYGNGDDQGIGFKLGGENQPVRHIVRNCISYDNATAGFSTNSNPLAQMENLLAWNNGSNPDKYNYRFITETKPDWRRRNLWTEKTWQERKPVLMFLVPRTSGGGAEKIITSLASQMIEHYQVYLVTTVKEDGVKGYAFSDKIEYINIYDRFGEEAAAAGSEPSEKRSLISRLRARLAPAGTPAEPVQDAASAEDAKFRYQIDCVKKLKAELDVDCAISFLNSANYINAMSKGSEKCIISIRSCLSGAFAPSDCRSDAGRQRIRAACSAADVIVPVSLEAGHDLEAAYGAPPSSLKTIYNFIDDSVVDKMRSEEIPDPGLREAMRKSAFTFISLGRLTEKKGQWHMIRAFRGVVDKHPEALLLIPGREGKKSENVADYLRDLIHENRLDDNVILPGFFDNPYPLLAGSDAYVMASFNEGFPNALVEAMAAGLPVIAGDCSSGPREILAPGTDYLAKAKALQREQYGILVPECSGHRLMTEPLEAEEQLLADAMNLMIENDGMRKEYAKNGLNRIRDFSKSDIISQWEDIIENDN
ncbi:MAG: glycosyltransferase [Bacillota bacterium]|nr:glycosyltransferase [Bacillota bacterium]